MEFTKIKSLSELGGKTIQKYLRLHAAEAPKYFNKVRDEVIYKKASDLNAWYTRILGLDEVRLYQERVEMLQEKLSGVQERRRNIGLHLTEIRKKSTDLQDQIHKVRRNDDLQKFLDLMKDETEILKLERDININFVECDREEREVFTAFTNAVRESHEKQRAQLEYTKYFGLILSIVGSFLTFCYSTLRKQDLKKFIEENLLLSSNTSLPILTQLHNNEKQLYMIKDYINAENQNMLKTINHNHKTIFHAVLAPKVVKLSNDIDKMVTFLEHNGSFPDSMSDKNSLILAGCVALVGVCILCKLFS